LTRKQKETRRGRAELLLEDRAAVWKGRPENRQLPSLLQWLRICWLTVKKSWTPPQRKMMRKATQYHAGRGLIVALLLALIGWSGYEVHGRFEGHALLGRLLDADTTDVPDIVKDMAPYRRWIDRLLLNADSQANKDGDHRKQLKISLALLPVDKSQVEDLYWRLLDAEPQEMMVIRDALLQHKDDLAERLWGILEDTNADPKQRFGAACALATYNGAADEARQRWAGVSQFVADRLLIAVVQNPSHYLLLVDMLRPIREELLGPLGEVYHSGERAESDRSFATSILADYAADHADRLVSLVQDADLRQFTILFPRLQQHREEAVAMLTETVGMSLGSKKTDKERELLAKQQANAAVVLLRMNQPMKVWTLLKHSPNPGVRSYLIHRVAPLDLKEAKIRGSSPLPQGFSGKSVMASIHLKCAV